MEVPENMSMPELFLSAFAVDYELATGEVEARQS